MVQGADGQTAAELTVLDCVGDWNGDPGSGWDVCGQGSTKDGTIVRNCDVTVGNGGDWAASSAEATCEWARYGQNHWDFGGYVASCAGAGSSDLDITAGIFGIVQSMSFTLGTGDPTDLEDVCAATVAAARATASTATGSIVDGEYCTGTYDWQSQPGSGCVTAFDYFRAVVFTNTIYTPGVDGDNENQEFIDLYTCAATDVPHWNAWNPDDTTPPAPPGMVDYAEGAHACNGRETNGAFSIWSRLPSR